MEVVIEIMYYLDNILQRPNSMRSQIHIIYRSNIFHSTKYCRNWYSGNVKINDYFNNSNRFIHKE